MIEAVERQQARNDAYERHYNQHNGDDAVHNPHRADIKVRAHAVNEARDAVPPKYGAAQNGDIAQHIVPGRELGSQEVEAGKKADYKEQYQRVGKGKDEARDHVAPIGAGRHFRVDKLVRGVVEKQVEGINKQDYGAQDLQNFLICLNEVRHKRKPQPRQQAIDKVGESRADARIEGRHTSLIERPLDNEHANRTHRSRDEYADNQAAE